MSQYYDANYFAWQKPLGEFGGWANLSKFDKEIGTSDRVLDFGCGGGFLLQNLDCAKRVGVEINATARKIALDNGVEVYESAIDVPDNYVDKIISNHALEHTLNPLEELRTLRTKLRVGGKMIVVVPCESIRVVFKPVDVNKHLFTWSPLNLGNLFVVAGFSVIESRAMYHRWPPFYRQIARFGGRFGFEAASHLYGRIATSLGQVRLVAVRGS